MLTVGASSTLAPWRGPRRRAGGRPARSARGSTSTASAVPQGSDVELEPVNCGAPRPARPVGDADAGEAEPVDPGRVPQVDAGGERRLLVEGRAPTAGHARSASPVRGRPAREGGPPRLGGLELRAVGGAVQHGEGGARGSRRPCAASPRRSPACRARRRSPGPAGRGPPAREGGRRRSAARPTSPSPSRVRWRGPWPAASRRSRAARRRGAEPTRASRAAACAGGGPSPPHRASRQGQPHDEHRRHRPAEPGTVSMSTSPSSRPGWWIGDRLADHAAHRVADQHEAVPAEVVDEGQQIGLEQLEAVVLGPGRVVAGPVAPEVRAPRRASRARPASRTSPRSPPWPP